MKRWAIAVLMTGAALIWAGSGLAASSSRSLHETIDLGTQGETPYSGGGSYVPAGMGVFGGDGINISGTCGTYSYDPSLYPIPPTETSLMGPGHAGSNDSFIMEGSAVISGRVRVPQAIVDEALAEDYTHLNAGWSCVVGSKLPTGLTGEPGDEYEYAGPRDTSALSGWKPSQWPPEGTFNGGTPCWPTDPGYEPSEPFVPQWDINGDGVTTLADYDYFVANGGFAAQRGEGAAGPVPFTEKDDPTIMKLDKGELVPASEGQEWYDDYYIDDNHNFFGTWKTVYLTGSQYRFHSFHSGASEPIYVTGDADFYVDSDYVQGHGCDMYFRDDGALTMAVKGNFIVTGEADINAGDDINRAGEAWRFDLVTLGSELDLENSSDGSAGTFYAPLADVHIAGNGYLFSSLVAGGEVVVEGSRKICYPIDYLGPNGGAGGIIGSAPPGQGTDPANPAEREDWKEIISHSDD